jgi:hypothetical protein
MAGDVFTEGDHPAIYRRAQDLRCSVHRITRQLTPGVQLIAALVFSLGLWGVFWLAVSSLASAWLS